jgi:hypothetical protein
LPQFHLLYAQTYCIKSISKMQQETQIYGKI